MIADNILKTSHSRFWELATVFASYITSFFVMGTLNNAMPRIAAELNGMQYYSWAIAVPALVSAITAFILENFLTCMAAGSS